MSWIPVSTAAACLVEMRQSIKPILHLAHPNPVPWSVVFEPISKALGVPLVSYSAWLLALEASSIKKDTAPASGNAPNPALYLLDFFQSANKPLPSGNAEAFGFPRLHTESAVDAAPSLESGNLSALGGLDVERWLKYWTKIGHLCSS